MSTTAHAREQIGAAVRAERKSRSLSVESAAKAGGIGHMTWRKIERGGSVHDQSYFAVDRAFGWQSGHTIITVHSGGEDLTPAPAPASDTGGPGETTTAEDKALATPVIDRYLAALRDRVGRDERNTGYYSTPDAKVYKIRDSSSFLSHEEYYLALDLLESLNLSEVRGLEHACSRLANETQQKLNAIHLELYSGREWKPGEAAATLQAKAHPEFNLAHSRYLEAYARLMEMQVNMYALASQRIGEIDDLDALHGQARELRERLDSAISELELILARHAQPNMDMEAK